MKFGRHILALGLLGFLGACGESLTISDNCDCGFYTLGDGGKLMHWPDGSKIRYEFDRNVPDFVRPRIAAAAHVYNNVLEKTSIALDISTHNAPVFDGDIDRVSRDGINGVYWVRGAWPWPDEPDTDGMTMVNFDRNGITEADIFLRAESIENEENRVNSTYNRLTSQPFAADPAVSWAYLLALHEFGHALGRVHTHERSSIMQPAVGVSLLRTGLSQFDLDLLGRVYTLRLSPQVAR